MPTAAEAAAGWSRLHPLTTVYPGPVGRKGPIIILRCRAGGEGGQGVGGRGHGEKSISPAADRDGAGGRGGVCGAAGCRRRPRRRLGVRFLEPPERGAVLER